MSPPTNHQNNHTHINDMIRKVVPEFRETKYGAFPMNESQWLSPASKLPGSGQPGFIAQKDKPTTIKQDYVWGPGTRGFGYYHLLTKEAYVILAARLHGEAGADTECGCFGGGSSNSNKNKSSSNASSTPSNDETKRVQHIMFSRSKSPVPNDGYAKEHAVQEAGASFRPPDDIGIWEMKLKAENNKK